MATVHIVKDGINRSGESITHSLNISADVASEKLGHFDTRHTEKPPTINPEVQASDWAKYKHVVLEISKGETIPPFSRIGYYYFVGLTPAECKRLLGVSFPSE